MLKSLLKSNAGDLAKLQDWIPAFAGMAFLVLAFLFLPAKSQAAELKFRDKTWTADVKTAELVDAKPIRSEFDLKSSVISVMTGKTDTQKQRLLAPETAAVVSQVAADVDQPAQSAKLAIDNEWAKDFNPGQDGQAVDTHKLRNLLLEQDTDKIDVPVLISYPQNTLESTNNRGIKELVAIGESDFSGSTKARIHNVEVGASRFNGLIIKQGEEFSFNKYLGEVDGEHGFLPELVIKRTGVVPEFGGGLCQVSSTAFRGAMNAGLNITARRNHSFAVHYYAPQGTDATIYPGVQDMKFVNDTPADLLVRTRIDIPNKKLYFDYYGTKDDRVVELDGPYQYDKKANGAMKATWTKRVTLNGQTTEQVFNSTYQPPELFETTTQAATPNPQAEATPANTTTAPTETTPTTPDEPVSNPATVPTT
jgi:vancomycin resistance protein YoaR